MAIKIQRERLHTATVRAIRQMIGEGGIGSTLPSERALSVQLGISRPVLREALAEMEKDGVLLWQGNRRCLAAGEKKRHRQLARICLLCRHAREVAGNETVILREQVALSLGREGLEIEVAAAPACFGPNPARFLGRLTDATPRTLWVLFRATPQIQLWFHENRIPALVLGGCYPNIDLPYLDTDYFSVCRHAAGLLKSRGHRQVAIIKAETELPGDRESVAGFNKGWPVLSDNKGLIVGTHDRGTASICRAVDRILSKREVPTAWLVFGTRAYLTVASRLAECRLRVGQDIHLLCRDSDPYFEFIVPSVAHYRRDSTRIKRRFLHCIRAFARDAAPPASYGPIPAEFVDGHSLGRI